MMDDIKKSTLEYAKVDKIEKSEKLYLIHLINNYNENTSLEEVDKIYILDKIKRTFDLANETGNFEKIERVSKVGQDLINKIDGANQEDDLVDILYNLEYFMYKEGLNMNDQNILAKKIAKERKYERTNYYTK